MRNLTWRIARPIGPVLSPDDFALADEAVPDITDGQVLVRTLYIGIAPGVRPLLPYAALQPDVAGDAKTGRARATEKDAAQLWRIQVGDRMQSGIIPPTSPYSGGTVGQVVRSRHPGFAERDYIFGGVHWQEYEAVDGDFSLRLDPAELPLEADLAAVGRSAFTGWIGYRRYCDAKPGETIVVSAAAGAVGMLVVQMAKAEGLTVIGIASGEDKCAFVTETLGADGCIDRLSQDIGSALDRFAPEGVDIYFDNVGGLAQRPVYDRLKPFGRLIVCGMAAEYGGTESSTLPTGMILAKRLRIQGFVVLDHEDEYPDFRADISRLLRAGALTYQTTIYDGIEQAPQALADCLSGRNAGGKLIVRVGEAATLTINENGLS
ncbi:hypothetical protein J3E64_003169 [Sphingobium sp. OAS761]|uniref:MDR family NADP-dependent oxidoreductase n=1 Tax=Sphingobium sp. OAS761 TaxID=2817901 RepID=UPI0020A07931|nr:NADP-dependent oxidoreductase [Sphingobium sp. OAS761]MCP1471462.1 hypothetical protein [Sphingobium sp. OAS761]